jgi:hypothetical protein
LADSLKTNPSKIVALDPGVTTGIAYYDADQPHPTCIWSGQLGPEKHHVALYAALRGFDPDVVVCERFVYQQRKGSVVLDSRNYIGVTELYCAAEGKTLKMQGPSEAKNLWSDSKLKRVNLYKPGDDGVHANDAVRHLLYCLTVDLKYTHWIKEAVPNV